MIVAACQDATSVPAPVSPQLIDVAAWSGGTLRVSSGGLLYNSSLQLLIAGDTLALTRVDDTTMSATLPDLGGSYAVTLRSPGSSWPLGSVSVKGYVQTRTGPPGAGYPLRQSGGQPVLAQIGPTGLEQIDLRTGLVQTLIAGKAAGTCVRGVSPAGLGAVIMDTTLGGACSALSAYTRGAGIAGIRVDSGPGSSGWPAAEVTPGYWIRSIKHFIDVWQRQNGTLVPVLQNIQYEQPWQFVISAHRVIPTGYGNSTPVFSADTPAVAYTLPRRVGAAQFTSGGDSIFVVTEDSTRHSYLEILRASDGVSLASVALPGFGQDLVLDPAGRWIYVTSIRTGNPDVPVVWVFDRATMARVAELAAPGTGVLTDQFFGNVAVPDAARHKLYVYDLFSVSIPVAIKIHEFDLLP